MKLKLIEPGYENYSGIMGDISFTSGVSDFDVSEMRAAGVANVLKTDWVTDAGADTGKDDTTAPTPVIETTIGDPVVDPIEQAVDGASTPEEQV